MKALATLAWVVALGLDGITLSAQTTNISLVATADAFLRAEAPQENYGRAGSLAVAGHFATNGFGVAAGQFDALLRFSLLDSLPSLEATFPNHDWFIARAVLRLHEVASPVNAIFPRGSVGLFEARWLATANWVEGTGSPNAPTDDGVTYEDLATLLNSMRDESLGRFTNSGLSNPITLPLQLPSGFVAALQSGAEATLHLRPRSVEFGFVFNSHNFVLESGRPVLELTVMAGPPPRMISLTRVSADEMAIRFTVRSNWTHWVQYHDALWAGGSSWANIAVPLLLQDGQFELLDRTTNGQRFYRLHSLPP